MIKDKNQTWSAFVLEMAILIIIVLCIRFYVFQLFRVSGPSMCPTLNELNQECKRGSGEFIFVNEFFYHFIKPKNGEVVIFKPPNKNDFYVKRIIGVPGDIVEVENGRVFLIPAEDTSIKIELPENYLSPKNKDRTESSMDRFEVPEDHYVVFGDNRSQSLDSRQCFSSIGCQEELNTPYVPRKNIIGRAEFVIWPFWQARKLQNTLDQQ